MSAYLDDSMPYEDVGDRCGKCKSPRVYKIGQDIPYCWECAINHLTAQRGQQLLARIKIHDSIQEAA